MRYSVGQQEVYLVSDVLDRTGAPVNGEVGTWWVVDRDGNSYTGSTTNPGANNDYEIALPTFDRPGRWYLHWQFTSPNAAGDDEFTVDYSPAAPVAP